MDLLEIFQQGALHIAGFAMGAGAGVVGCRLAIKAVSRLMTPGARLQERYERGLAT